MWSIHWLHFIEVSTLKYLNPKFTILSNEKFYKETNAEKQAEIRKNMLRLVKKFLDDPFLIFYPLLI